MANCALAEVVDAIRESNAEASLEYEAKSSRGFDLIGQGISLSRRAIAADQLNVGRADLDDNFYCESVIKILHEARLRLRHSSNALDFARASLRYP